ncbi:PP2C family serine/threonine-protein phosphatase [Azospirillum sp. BE72]|uniref:PP2C family serine/threonine-protein phosphatase n=1 Tax=Azospirillum sp. BE72 TaxID=2817776 RepID=UPI0028640238|nr:PP2C family serine/threonine-protein phosphatase [Azospirillum sp. BE72]MDR6775692.1 hypothetical protein [Azospirillum sp. BE72]
MTSPARTDRVSGADAAPWRVVGASVVGPSHVHAGLPNQDAYAFEVVDGALIVVVCDGAGSAASAEVGAGLMVRALLDNLRGVSSTASAPLAVWVTAAVRDARQCLEEAAVRAGLPLSDYHTTVVAAVLLPQGDGFVLHIGDGAAVASASLAEDGTANWNGASVSAPENGEYANETFFVTQSCWADHLRITPLRGVTSILLMTDGAASFALHADGSPKVGFCEAVDRHLRRVHHADGAKALAASLASEKATHNPDDKTLVWARRY